MTNILKSNYHRLCSIDLPYKGRQRYMHSFDLAKPVMAEGFEDYLRPVVSLCRAARATYGIAYMTVDEKIIMVSMSQRRPGPHVDGCFMPENEIWGHPSPSWAHYCNQLPVERMPVIVAASVPGCRAWAGEFVGRPNVDGDLSHICEQLGEGEVLPAYIGYLLSPDCVHESMIFSLDTKRTFLRIALDSACAQQVWRPKVLEKV